jgi:UDP-N-acetylglucosamine:LPS N-acetylglucosamine transferase
MSKKNANNSDGQNNKQKKAKVCLISSSGGHYRQLLMLKPLEEKYDIFIVTEATKYKSEANYHLLQSGLKDWLFPIKTFLNSFKTIYIIAKERPDFVVTTGTMVAIPMCFICKLLRKKVVYIETFSRVTDCTRTGKLMYKIADLFIYQWEELAKYYPNGVYGGSIY